MARVSFSRVAFENSDSCQLCSNHHDVQAMVVLRLQIKSGARTTTVDVPVIFKNKFIIGSKVCQWRSVVVIVVGVHIVVVEGAVTIGIEAQAGAFLSFSTKKVICVEQMNLPGVFSLTKYFLLLNGWLDQIPGQSLLEEGVEDVFDTFRRPPGDPNTHLN